MDVFKTQFIDKLTAVHGLPRGRNLEDMLTIYREQLGGESMETYEIAVKSLIQTTTYWPKIPECIKALKEAREALGRKTGPQKPTEEFLTEEALFRSATGQRALRGGYGNILNDFRKRHGRKPDSKEEDAMQFERLAEPEIQEMRSGNFEGKRIPDTRFVNGMLDHFRAENSRLTERYTSG